MLKLRRRAPDCETWHLRPQQHDNAKMTFVAKQPIRELVKSWQYLDYQNKIPGTQGRLPGLQNTGSQSEVFINEVLGARRPLGSATTRNDGIDKAAIRY
ncbi:hypothetical protein Dda_5049 [Drechslerella dactyloides]|uniref:Uncharacterized protein n=1 Tax=Drechslerella dactyloides TaxID=74499 RepID=A0AAD6IY43_DREDA|nr:hypothetical protein Dda_5049 [Drechslerella dactyloides]